MKIRIYTIILTNIIIWMNASAAIKGGAIVNPDGDELRIQCSKKSVQSNVKSCSEFSMQLMETSYNNSAQSFSEIYKFRIDLMNADYEEIKEREIERLEYFSIVKSEKVDQFLEVLIDNSIPDVTGGFIFAPISIPVVWVTGMMTIIGTVAADIIKSPYTLISNIGAESRSELRKKEILLHFLTQKNNKMKVTRTEFKNMRYLFSYYQI